MCGWLKCCFTSTETVGLLETGAQNVHLDFHIDREVWYMCGESIQLNMFSSVG